MWVCLYLEKETIQWPLPGSMLEVLKDFPNIKYDEDLLDHVCLQVQLISHVLEVDMGV